MRFAQEILLFKTEQTKGMNDRSTDCKFVEAALNRVITIIHKTQVFAFQALPHLAV